MKTVIASIVMASTALAGCTTSGGMALSPGERSGAAPGTIVYAVNPAIIASFTAGVTTLEQVEARLGKPAGSTHAASGNQVIAYAITRNESVDSDRTPETGTALPRRHKIRYTTLLSFDPQGRWITAWTRTDDLGDASPGALGNMASGDIMRNIGG